MSPAMKCGYGLFYVWISADFPVGRTEAGTYPLTKGLSFPKKPGIPDLSIYHEHYRFIIVTKPGSQGVITGEQTMR